MATAPARLSDATLAGAAADVARPRYDRQRVQTGIVHLGLGAFVRAHAAIYTDDVLASGDHRWGIAGVSLQRPDQRTHLHPQDGLYTALERSGDAMRARIVGSVLDVLVAPQAPAAVIARLAAPATRIVSLTITEKGYCHDPASGRLRADHPDIRHDLAHPEAPRTALGFIVACLAARRVAGLPPVTVLCCDNLAHNGRLLARLVHDFAALGDDKLAAWIARTTAFPSTMVDRIVPAVTPADLADTVRLTGLTDAAPVSHEPFSQWVIEDNFVESERPRWETFGAKLVTDVAPYETMKLRLLNGAHSALAYLGYLGSLETIGACVADPAYRGFVQKLWRDEIIPVVAAPAGVDLSRYTTDLLGRFDNSAIRHRTWQIAMDGSQKLPQRLLATVQTRLDRGLTIDRLALAVAAWVRYVGGVDEHGRAIDVRDPLAGRLAALLNAAGPDSAARVAAMLAVAEVFPPELAAHPGFASALAAADRLLATEGARAAVVRLA